MAPVSRTSGGQSRTGPTERLPEIVRSTRRVFRTLIFSQQML